MSTELGTVVLLGLGCAANPWGIMIAVLLLEAKRGHGIVWSYVVAWVGAITVVLTVILAGFGTAFSSSSNSATTGMSVAQLVFGLSLLALGLNRVVGARRGAAAVRSGDPPVEQETPGWLGAIENISYVGAFLLGIYSATYPLVVAAGGEILRADASTSETVGLAVLFVILGSSSVVGVAALGTFAPSRSATSLGRLRAWLTVHNRAVITAILLVFGVFLTARGISGLA